MWVMMTNPKRHNSSEMFANILREHLSFVKFVNSIYENTGNSTIDVTLEETARTGEVVYSQGLNLRSTPSTLNNTPIDGLDPGERFTIQQKVSSPDDVTYPDWYEVVTDGGQQGYVAADSVFVDLIDAGRVAYSQGLNLRETPSTLNNTPIDGLCDRRDCFG